jgi:hypothetical protein
MVIDVPGVIWMLLSPEFLLLVVASVVTILVWRRHPKRFRQGLCQVCSYDLTGLMSGRCPECGTWIARPVHSAKQ